MNTPAHIVPLRQITDAQEAGGKAWNLARLITLGQPVPDGVVLTRHALSAFLDAHDLGTAIDRAVADLDPRSPEGIAGASAYISGLVADRELPAALGADLDLAIASFSPEPVIVRSSAIGEDGDDASFAGQLDSIPDVMGPATVRRAVRKVWASRWSARSLTYQLARRRTLAGMGVVVQRQVDAAISGVLFTVSPADPRTMAVEYCAGAGEDLVSGRVNPGRISIDRRTLRWSSEAVPERQSADDGQFVCDTQIRSLARRALEIERAFGGPQDIEWTMDRGGRIWIVQARPITVAAAPRPADAPRRMIWSNANVNENFPQPISPLLYSLARRGYYHYFRNLVLTLGLSRRRVAAMEQPLRQIIGVHGARMYYNLTSIHGVLRSAPFGDLLAAWFNRFVGSEDTDTPAAVARAAGTQAESAVLSRVMQAGELAAIAAKTTWQYLFVTRRVARFERTVTLFAAATHPDRLRTRPRLELAADLRAFLDIRCNRWTDASLADTAAMVCYGALERVLRRAFPGEDQAALHNSLLKALPGLPSGVPAVELWELSRLVRADTRLRHVLDSMPPQEAFETIRRQPHFQQFAQELDRFLEDWGFRCSGELMLTVKSFQEDPASLLPILQAYVLAEGSSPADHLREQRAQRLRDTARVAVELRKRRLLRFVPFLHQWHVVSRLLASTQHAILLRERARLKQALLYSRLRRVALALGQRFVEEGCFARADDVFLLTIEELDDLATGSEMFPHHVRDLVDLRRRAHADLSAMQPPDSLALDEGEYLLPGAGSGARPADSDPRSATRDPRPATRDPQPAIRDPRPATRDLKGLGVCGGSTRARAAVLADVTEAHRLRRGDVLVTRQTDPGWGAVFPLISGLVMERGGMLSHGAIIAREFGIPSVVGIADATRLVPHGAEVEVNGDLGTLRVHTPAAREKEARAS
jgi:phosphohistidine swiveling domain-containing protein